MLNKLNAFIIKINSVNRHQRLVRVYASVRNKVIFTFSTGEEGGFELFQG